MIYLFDKKQEIVGLLDKSDIMEARLNLKINTAASFDLALPLKKTLSSVIRYIGVPHPLDSEKYLFFRLVNVKDSSDKVEYAFYELAYQELGTYSYIKDRRFRSADASTLMKAALDNSPWQLGKINVPGNLHTNYYYISNLEAINGVVNGLGGEIVFYVQIVGNKIVGRYMDYVVSQGTDTSKVFVHGSNLLNVERTGDSSSIFTAILPRGKGEQVSEGDDDTPDGYGRRITIEDCEWKKSNNDPLDKPSGEVTLIDPVATDEYGHIDGHPRLLIKTYEDIDDKWELINAAYRDLMQANHPAYQYSVSITDVKGLSLGDTVLIMHNDRKMSYKTRVFEVNYDLVNPDNTTLNLGEDLSNNSITQTMASITSTAQYMSNTLSWTMSHGGNNDTTFGPNPPSSPRKGNVWYKQLNNGTTELRYWDGNAWILSAETDSQWKKNRAELNGDHTVYRGPDTPSNPQQGDTWYKDDVNEKNGVAMYSYSGTEWIKYNGITDANMLQQGRIDASRINVLNLDANNIATGHLSADFIKGGQIDASQINVINMNVNSLIGNVSQFIKSQWDGIYGSTTITGEGMTVNSGASTTFFNRDGMHVRGGNTSSDFNLDGIFLHSGNKNLTLNSNGLFVDNGSANAMFDVGGLHLHGGSAQTDFNIDGTFFHAGDKHVTLDGNGLFVNNNQSNTMFDANGVHIHNGNSTADFNFDNIQLFNAGKHVAIDGNGLFIDNGDSNTMFDKDGVKFNIKGINMNILHGWNGSDNGLRFGGDNGGFISFGFGGDGVTVPYNEPFMIASYGSKTAFDHHIAGGSIFKQNVSFMDNVYWQRGNKFYMDWGNNETAISFTTINGGIPAIMNTNHGNGIALGLGGELYLIRNWIWFDWRDANISGSVIVD